MGKGEGAIEEQRQVQRKARFEARSEANQTSGRGARA
jgi:hypothetical protein